MKTFVVLTRLLCSIVIFGIYHIADAQTIISFDASPDNTMVMKIQDPTLSDKTDKLILIFDSTTLTCEFSDDGIIALHATSNKSGSSVITSSYSYEFSNETDNKINLLKVIDECENTQNEVEKEDPLSLEGWMLRPDEWNENDRL